MRRFDMKKTWVILVMLFVILTANAAAEQTTGFKNIGYYIDEKNLTIEEIVNIDFTPLASPFKKNFGVTKNSVWLRFSVKAMDFDNHYYIDTGTSADEADLFYPKPDGTWITERTGSMIPFSKKNLKTLFPVFRLNNCCSVYYLKLRSGYNIRFDPKINPEKSYVRSFNGSLYFNGIFAGILLALILYNLFVYISVRDIRYLYYVIFIALFLIWSLDFLGFSRMLWLKEQPWIRRYSFRVFHVLMVVSAVQFSKRMMNIRYYYPKINRLLNFIQLVLLFILLPVGFFVGKSIIYYRSSQAFSLMAALTVLAVSVLLSLKKNRPAYFFLASVFMFVFAVFFYILLTLQLLPPIWFGNYIIQLTIAIQGIPLIPTSNKARLVKRRLSTYDLKRYFAA